MGRLGVVWYGKVIRGLDVDSDSEVMCRIRFDDDATDTEASLTDSELLTRETADMSCVLL